MEKTVNQITLRGTLHEKPTYSHENHGKQFYRFLLDVPRLSGTTDVLPVVAEKRLLEDTDLSNGSMLTIHGQIRSHNIREDGKRRLLIFVFASSLVCEDGPALNQIILEGILCRMPVFRFTPLGREICDCMLAVPRGFHRSDYLPCIFWGRTARYAAHSKTGDRITLQGRFQSRSYTKSDESGETERTAYEISVLTAQWQSPDASSNTAE